MSTFKGRIKEYPAIAIDFFIPNGYSKYFVLSHVHKGEKRKKYKFFIPIANYEISNKWITQEDWKTLISNTRSTALKQLQNSYP